MEVDHFLKVVDEVTPKDIASIAQKLLSSPLTLASYGDGICPILTDSFNYFVVYGLMVICSSLFSFFHGHLFPILFYIL